MLVNTRKSYGLLDWLASIGGIAKSVMAVFGFVSFFFSYQIFIKTVLENLFFIKKGLFRQQDELKKKGTSKSTDLKSVNSERKMSDTLRQYKTGGFRYQDLKKTDQVQQKRLAHMCIDEQELEQFNKLKEDIEDDEVTKESVDSIVRSIYLKRCRFGGVDGYMSQLSIMKYYVLEYFFSFCINKKKKANREYATYLNGYRKFNKELDVVSLLRSVRLSKVLYYSTLNTR